MHPTPQWFKDAKFGIYTHWGIYYVPAEGPNGTWYGYFMYRKSKQHDYQLEHYGPIHEIGEEPTEEYNENWKNKTIEVIDKYDPDLIWFDSGMGAIMDKTRREVMSHYFNLALKRKKKW
jgi:alpha-L-fucosidase